MQIDVTRKLMTIDSKPIDIPDSEACEACGRQRVNGRVMLLRNAMVDALLGGYDDEAKLSGADKVERYQIALRVQNEDAPEMTIQDLALIQELVAKRYAPLVTGQVWMMLEGAKEKGNDK